MKLRLVEVLSMLRDFQDLVKKEEQNMLVTDIDWRKDIRFQEGRQEGMLEGKQEGIEEGIQKGSEITARRMRYSDIESLSRKGFSLEWIADVLNMPLKGVEDIYKKLKEKGRV